MNYCRQHENCIFGHALGSSRKNPRIDKKQEYRNAVDSIDEFGRIGNVFTVQMLVSFLKALFEISGGSEYNIVAELSIVRKSCTDRHYSFFTERIRIIRRLFE